MLRRLETRAMTADERRAMAMHGRVGCAGTVATSALIATLVAVVIGLPVGATIVFLVSLFGKSFSSTIAPVGAVMGLVWVAAFLMGPGGSGGAGPRRGRRAKVIECEFEFGEARAVVDRAGDEPHAFLLGSEGRWFVLVPRVHAGDAKLSRAAQRRWADRCTRDGERGWLLEEGRGPPLRIIVHTQAASVDLDDADAPVERVEHSDGVLPVSGQLLREELPSGTLALNPHDAGAFAPLQDQVREFAFSAAWADLRSGLGSRLKETDEPDDTIHTP